MKIDDHYSLSCDNNGWTLHYEHTHYDEKRDKEVTSRHNWYYGTIHQCLKRYVDEKVKAGTTPEVSATKLIKLTAEAYKRIAQLEYIKPKQ